MMLSEHSRLIKKFDTCRTAFVMCCQQEKTEWNVPYTHDSVHVGNAMATVHKLIGPERSVFVALGPHRGGVGDAYEGIQLPEDAVIEEKLQQSTLTPAVRLHLLGNAELDIPPVQQVVLWGTETHGCILQAADELLAQGLRVAVLVDGCASHSREVHNIAVMQMSHWDGLMLTTAPSAIMQLTRSDARCLKPIIHILKKLSADWKGTQGLPNNRDPELQRPHE